MSLVGLGDLARVLADLAPENTGTRERILELLGFETSPAPQREAPPAVPAHPEPRPPEPPASIVPKTDTAPPQRIDPVAIEQPRSSRRFLEVPPLELPRSSPEPDLVFEPLLAPRWTRGILSAAVSVRTPEGPIDLLRLVDTAARGRPLRSIPRLPQPSLFRGVQVLVDLGEGMELFARDQVYLLGEIRRVVGKESTRVIHFRDSPLRGAGSGPLWTWDRYQLPDPGTPVLALTDLGIGGPLFHPDRGTEQEWLELFRQLAERSCPLVALVPYPAARWPRKLARSAAIFSWDRSTNAGTIGRTIRRGHEVRP